MSDPGFLRARYPSCYPVNSVKALKGTVYVALLLARLMGQYCFARWRLS